MLEKGTLVWQGKFVCPHKKRYHFKKYFGKKRHYVGKKKKDKEPVYQLPDPTIVYFDYCPDQYALWFAVGLEEVFMTNNEPKVEEEDDVLQMDGTRYL